MKTLIHIFLVFCWSISISQNSLISVDEQHKDIGVQENIYKIKTDYIITNHLQKNLYLLRADATKGIIIKAGKKTVKPNDTTLISIEFIPNSTGKFKENIELVTSADGLPYVISISGNIKSIKTDDKTACFYFKKQNNAGVKNADPIEIPNTHTTRDNSNKIPDNTVVTKSEIPEIKEQKTTVEPDVKKPINENELDEQLYKPNNIIFLVDVSSSMKDTNKLKVMQFALNFLIDNLRAIDKISLITYADSVRILKDGVKGNEKENLKKSVNSLKAKGLTKGNKAILFSLDYAIKNYINNGNNQIILITDGKFRFYPDDQKLFKQKQGDKNVKLSTIAVGKDKEALKNLKQIAEIGNGNFIHIKNKEKAKEQLLDEIKQNSVIQ